jgi:hypothetical protein
MRCSPIFNRWVLSAALALALSLVPAAGALGASPKAGKLYTGPTSASYNGFTAPVSFTVSKNGRQLLSFKWAGGGCIGLGGPGNAWTNREMNYKVGRINVSRTGAFAVKNVKWTFRGKQGGHAFTKVTTSTVTGRFKNATTATGTISFTQKITKTCSGKVSFTATLGPAPGALHKLRPASGISVASTTPTLSWSASTKATAYRYCIATSENGRCIGGWVSTNTRTHATLRALQPGRYYWQVIASSVHGTVAADNGGWSSFSIPAPQSTFKPTAGHWYGSVSGPVSSGPGIRSITVTSIEFTVEPDQATVAYFTFGFSYTGSPTSTCSGYNSWAVNNGPTSPIVEGHFSVPTVTGPWLPSGGSGTYEGTFDSPRLAHGTAQLSFDLVGAGCAATTVRTGTFTWSAGG